MKQMFTQQNIGDAVSQGGLTKNNSVSSIKSIAKQRWQFNPLFGYSIEAITALKPNTVVYRIKANIYERFLSPDNFRKWDEKSLMEVFPP